MEDPTVLGMIYEDVKVMKKDIEEIKMGFAKVIGGSLVVSFLATIVFQLVLAYIQRG